jgi:protein-tyrosine phosphatase
MMNSAVLIPGTHNSRDLGGTPADGGTVRERTIIRSDALANLGAAGRATLRELGLKTAIDLREPVERRLDPPDLDGLNIEVRHQPIIGKGLRLVQNMSLSEIYRQLLASRGENLTAAVRRLAEPGAMPAIVFCSAGKDRTGLVSALVLGALGADDEAIVADYARTEQNMRGEFREAMVRRARSAGLDEQELAVKVGSPPSLMRETLEWLHEHHGGPAAYLLHHGMTDSEIAVLRRELVVPRRAKAA